jgi:hypothetical protein
MSRPRRKRRDDDESLIGSDAQQMTLLDVPEHPLEAESRVTKRCTGQLLFERDRKVYDEVIQALASNKSVRYCMKMWGLGTHTVLAISRREKLEVATRKTSLADAMLLGAEVYAERALELAGTCDDAYQAAGTAKMLAETSNLMRGQATSIMGAVIVHVDANAMAAKLAEKARRMDSGAGEKGALVADSASDALALPSLDIKAAVAPVITVDCERVTVLSDTIRDTLTGSDGLVSTRGGGGSAENSCPSSISIGGAEIL